MSVLQPFQFLKFSKDIRNQLRYREGCKNNLCDLPVIPQGKFVPFGIISPSNVVGNVTLYCHTTGDAIVYHSVQAQSTCIKNDCPVGYVGTSVTYTVPAGKYTSIISQADANQQAYDDAYYNCQAYANAHGECISEETYSLIVDEQFDNWSGGMPVGWVFNDVDYTTATNDSNRLDLGISAYPPVTNWPQSANYPNIECDTGLDFGLYSQLRIKIQVDSATGNFYFVFRFSSTISYIRLLNLGLNEINLIKGFGYNDGYGIIGIKNYSIGATYPKNMVIDYITIEGLS